jgi:hypothetical protein
VDDASEDARAPQSARCDARFLESGALLVDGRVDADAYLTEAPRLDPSFCEASTEVALTRQQHGWEVSQGGGSLFFSTARFGSRLAYMVARLQWEMWHKKPTEKRDKVLIYTEIRGGADVHYDLVEKTLAQKMCFWVGLAGQGDVQGIMRPYLCLLEETGRRRLASRLRGGASIHLHMVPEIARTLRMLISIVVPSGREVVRPSTSDMPVFLISRETEEGARRRHSCNFEFQHVPAAAHEKLPDWLRDRMVRGRRTEASFLCALGCFHSHTEAWRAMGAGAGIVAEDDARQIRELPAVWPLVPCLLGGALRTKGAWSRERQEYYEAGTCVRELSSLRCGVFQVPGKWTMSVAYYLPAGFAAVLLKSSESARSLCCVDVWLNEHIRHGWFPNPFCDALFRSQCMSPSKDLAADLFMNRQGRKSALSMGARIEVGMAPSDFLLELGRAQEKLRSSQS